MRTILIMLPQLGSLSAPYRCRIPELESKNWTFQQLLNISTNGHLNGCEYQVTNYTILPDKYEDAYSSLDNEGIATQTCNHGFIYDYESAPLQWSYTMEYDLICSQAYLKPLVNSIGFLGVFCGVLATGYLGDHFGRRRSTLWISVILVLAGVARSFSPSIMLFAFLTFVANLASNGSWFIGWIWMMEVLGSRGQLLMQYFSDFSWGFAISAQILVCYLLQDWRFLNLSFLVPTLVLPLVALTMPESPKWLYSKGRYAESFKILKKIERSNNSSDNTHPLTIEKVVQISNSNGDFEDESNISNNDGLSALIATPRMRQRTFILLYAWTISSILYYSYTFVSVELPGNVYLNAFINNVSAIPSTIFVYFFAKRFNRKFPVIICFITVALFSGTTTLLLTHGGESLQMAAIFTATLSKCSVDIVQTILRVYTAELIPAVRFVFVLPDRQLAN